MQLPDQILRTFRALRRLRLIDLRGHLSARLPNNEVLITPASGLAVPPPVLLTGDDLVRVDLDGHRLAGRWSPPRDVELHLQIYRSHSEVRAVLYAQPRTVLAYMASGARLLPLTHVESELVMPPLPRFGHGELVVERGAAAKLADLLANRPAMLLPGQGIVTVGGSVAEAGARCYQLELLASVNAVAAPLPNVHLVGAEDSARVVSQRAGPDDYLTYFDAVAGPDPRPAGAVAPGQPELDEGEIRIRVAQACHLLYRHRLVEMLEHVSHRLPGDSGFLITPRKHLGQLEPGDLAEVDMDGKWLAGPLAPPPFLFLHRDIFLARPEVRAIVHTHQLYARAYAITDEPVLPLYRAGAAWLRQAAPIYPVPDLIFDEVHRRGTVAALGRSNIVHERSHGTDYVAPTIEAATVAALHYELAAKLQHQARALGTPVPLPAAVLDRLDAEEPPAEAWWRDYLTELT
jgi:ribulose-5-phosphate 4-epimerase/fuculose-1-phosphate aldolase